jgi:hypothetical protein
MVLVADAEPTSARPPAIAIAFANDFLFFYISMLPTDNDLLKSTSVRSLCFDSVFLRYGSQAPPR